jgi:hypothetical protein
VRSARSVVGDSGGWEEEALVLELTWREDVELFLSRDRGGDKIRSSHVMMCTKDFRIFKQLLFFTRFRMYRSA